MVEVKWLPQAENDLDDILQYLHKTWGENVMEDFLSKLERIIKIICERPTMFRRSIKMNIHQVLVTKHNLLFYRIKENNIEILTLFNTKRDPAKKPF